MNSLKSLQDSTHKDDVTMIYIQDAAVMYNKSKCCPSYWLNMEPSTGRPKSAALSHMEDPEIKFE